MSLKSRIFDFLPELQDSEIIDSHKEVLDSINNFNELIPKEYSNYNLVEIIKPKVCYSGSVSPKQPISLPAAMSGRYFFF